MVCCPLRFICNLESEKPFPFAFTNSFWKRSSFRQSDELNKIGKVEVRQNRISAASVLSADEHDHGGRVGRVPAASRELCRCQELEHISVWLVWIIAGMALICIQQQEQQLCDPGSFLTVTVTCCDNLLTLAAAMWFWSQQLPDHRGGSSSFAGPVL